jgi:glucose/arabinose dehydrogenase
MIEMKHRHIRTAPVRRWLLTAVLSAMPLAYPTLAADSAAATKPAATKPTTAEKKKEDKDAWKLAENWKLDILAEKPAIHHPSVLFPAPDGRIFLAEDPMDMKGSSKDPTDRILVIHPDGKITVFAEGLYAVFGMQYIDGKLYVHHTPKLSVFTDVDGVGKDRVDLIDSDNPSHPIEHSPGDGWVSLHHYRRQGDLQR